MLYKGCIVIHHEVIDWLYVKDEVLELLCVLQMLAGELLYVSRVLLRELLTDTMHHIIPVLLLSPLISAHTHSISDMKIHRRCASVKLTLTQNE